MHTVLQYISNIRATLVSSLFRNCIEFLVFDEYWISLIVVCLYVVHMTYGRGRWRKIFIEVLTR